MEEVKATSTLKLTLEEPIAFNAVGEIAITTTRDLAGIINSLFKKVFADYYGCQLSVQFQPERQNYVVIPLLFFKVLDKKAYYNSNVVTAFSPVGVSASNSSIIGRVQLLSMTATSGQNVEITEDGKSILEDFRISSMMKDQTFDWTTAYRTFPTESDTFIQCFKLDINKFIAKLFGEKDKYGSDQYYQITPTYVIGGQTQYKKPDNWSLHILRLNHDNEAEAAKTLGMYIPNQVPLLESVVTDIPDRR